MGLQIVTGYTGTAHIKSAHDRARNAGTVGTGSYVMRTGNMLAAKMQSANTLRIVDEDLMMQGVHATVEAGTHEDLTVDNGTQGKKRNDLVVARYERLAGEPKTESVTLRVIKGEPSDGAAADPAYTEGDILGGDLVAEMPLYRVPIDGITPGEPVALFETVPTIAELRDSVSQTEYFASSESEFSFTPKVSGVIVAQVWAYDTYGAWGGEIGLHVTTPIGLQSVAKVSTGLSGSDGVPRMVTAKAVFAGVEAGKPYYFKTENNPNAGWAKSTPFSWLLEVRPY